MIDRSTNCKAFFRQRVKEFFKFETGKLDSKIYEVHKAHSEWILSIGWNDKSNYLEKIAMLFSEVYEMYCEYDNENESPERACTRQGWEISDVLLRTLNFIYCLDQETEGQLNLEAIMSIDTVIDNRFENLNRDDFVYEDWAFALYTKLGSLVNSFRSFDLNTDSAIDKLATLNQIIYMCLIMLSYHRDKWNLQCDLLDPVWSKIEKNKHKKLIRDK